MAASESNAAVGPGSLPHQFVVKSSGAVTATDQYGPIGNLGARGVHVIIDVTAVADTPSVVFTLQGYDPASGDWYNLLVSSAVVATGTTVLKVYPGIAAVANGAASDCLPAVWRIDATHADADSITFSLGAVLLP